MISRRDWLQTAGAALLTEETAGQVAQVAMHQRRQLLEGRDVATAPLLEQAGQISGLSHPGKCKPARSHGRCFRPIALRGGFLRL